MNAMQYYMDDKDLSLDFKFKIGEVLLSKGKPKVKILEESLSVYE